MQVCARAVIQQISKLTAMVSTKGKPKPDDWEDRSWTELTSKTSPPKSGLREHCGNDSQLTAPVPIPVMGQHSCIYIAWVAKRPTLALS